MDSELPNWCGELVEHCRAKVPRYRGMPPRFDAFPIVKKTEMVTDVGAYVSDAAAEIRSELVGVLEDPERKRAPAECHETAWKYNIVIEETSGTSGLPFNFPRTTAERTAMALALWRRRKDIDPHVNAGSFYPFFHAPRGFRHAINPFDCTGENVRALYAHLGERGVRWVHAYPGLLWDQAQALHEPLPSGSVRFAETSGSVLTDEVRTAAKEKLGLALVNQYGCREVWAVGYSEGQAGFVPLEDNVFVEVVDENGFRIHEEGKEGRVVVTSRRQRLFPFVRYDTGDCGYWAPERGGRRFSLLTRSREPREERWGRYKSGGIYFKNMLARAYQATGFIKIQYLQIRETAPMQCCVVTSPIQQAEKFLAALSRACREDGAVAPIVFRHRTIKGEELQQAHEQKPCLFHGFQAVDNEMACGSSPR